MPKSQKDGFSLKKNFGDNITSSHVNFTSFSVERCEGIEGNGEQGELDIILYQNAKVVMETYGGFHDNQLN
jgi:hypothetical protein